MVWGMNISVSKQLKRDMYTHACVKIQYRREEKRDTKAKGAVLRDKDGAIRGRHDGDVVRNGSTVELIC